MPLLIQSAGAVEDVYEQITSVLKTVHRFSGRLNAYMYANTLSLGMQGVVAETFATYLEIITISIELINRGRVRKSMVPALRIPFRWELYMCNGLLEIPSKANLLKLTL